MKLLDVRHCWLQEELEKGNFKVERVDRKFNAGSSQMRWWFGRCSDCMSSGISGKDLLNTCCVSMSPCIDLDFVT